MPETGQILSHYRLAEKIGEGGMGVVYRARDEHLGRDVAVKVLPAGALTDERARKRFRREAQALSKLNHPNVETVYDFDTEAGVDFLVIEYIPGITLNDKLASGPMPEKELGGLGVQLAEGLTAAKKESIVHRDIKPGNLRVSTDGRLKILDFGLAKLVRPVGEQATTESLTRTDAVVGTLAYMAPELLEGQTCDHRGDIYSAGVVLYEMATGRLPFRESLSTALAGAILHRPPTPPRQLRPDLSPRLEEIILKCLEKDRERRYQFVEELAVDLRRLATPATEMAPTPAPRRWWPAAVAVGLLIVAAMTVVLNAGGVRDWLVGLGAAPRTIESVAVLPLDDMMGDSEQDFFADGMTEALITQLSKIGALKVISSQSVMRYKGSDKPLPLIGRELGVDAVVEGSVLRSQGRVRVSAQLIEARTDEHLWADSFDHELGDVLALHGEIAQAIAREIKVALSPEEEARLSNPRPVDPEAFEAYLTGRHHQSNSRVREAAEYYEQAIAIDPSYAEAYAALSTASTSLGYMHVLAPDVAFPKAKATAKKAIEIDDSLASAHAALGFVVMAWEWDWSAAGRELQRAVALDPNSARARGNYSHWLMCMGRHDESIAEARRARELDPLSPRTNATLGVRFYFARQYEQAIEQSRKTLEMQPGYDLAHITMGFAYLEDGRHEEAIEAFQEVEGTQRHSSLGYAYGVVGQRADAEAALESLHADRKEGLAGEAAIALIHVGLGESGRAIEWLEMAFRNREPQLVYLGTAPPWDPLRADPRFQDLIDRMNFPGD